MARKAGIVGFIKFDPSIVRGLDYYTGMVFEQYDLTPGNTRAMFGGGRYDDLLTIFIDEKIPATGLAIGDVTFLDFLTSWKLLPDLSSETEYFVTVWPSEDPKFAEASRKEVEKLRAEGKNAEIWLDSNTKLDKQLKYADRKGIKNAVIIGPEELEKGTTTVKKLV
jgi:histidyl-tRNA synthetase